MDEHPSVHVEERVEALLEELVAEHDRAAETVALSYAEDADLHDLELGGELHPFQRAGVRYALARRRTFIADEQGLGKTVQALATLEADDAYPAVVVCPASMKLMWERESLRWLPRRTVAVLDGRTDAAWTEAAEAAEIVVLNYDILEAHAERLAAGRPRALVLDESHYLKNPRARRTKAAVQLVGRLPDDALRLALTGTPILNRPDELVAQLRILGPSDATSAAAPGWRAASAPRERTTGSTGTCAPTATCAGPRSRCCRSCPPSARTPCPWRSSTSTSTGSRRPT